MPESKGFSGACLFRRLKDPQEPPFAILKECLSHIERIVAVKHAGRGVVQTATVHGGIAGPFASPAVSFAERASIEKYLAVCLLCGRH
jgi:hypothetical protein